MTKLIDKVATIVPVRYLELTRFDEYFMALSHLVSIEAYARFFIARSREGRFVILDNSVVETGLPETSAVYLEKALMIDAREIVVPDHPLDMLKTLREIEPFLKLAEQAGYRRMMMGVPHGQSLDEYLSCLDTMMTYPIDCIGISRLDYDRGIFENRRIIADEIHRRDQNIRIHLLGCTNSPLRDLYGALHLPEVAGVDSSIAALCAKNGLTLTRSFKRPPEAEAVDLEHDLYDEALLRQNIRIWKDLCVSP